MRRESFLQPVLLLKLVTHLTHQDDNYDLTNKQLSGLVNQASIDMSAAMVANQRTSRELATVCHDRTIQVKEFFSFFFNIYFDRPRIRCPRCVEI